MTSPDTTNTTVYLDYNATTPMAPEVIQAVTITCQELWGNPSSSYKTGERAKDAVNDAREAVASMLGCDATDVLFVSGGTEANNLVIHTAVKRFQKWCQETAASDMKPHVIASNVEHDSVKLVLEHLKEQIDVTYVSAEKWGIIRPDDVKSNIRPNTCLVTVMLANNETGVIMPVKRISTILKEINKTRKEGKQFPILTHTDAAQAFGKIPVDVRDLGVDYLTVVGHKFYGPRIGALYCRQLGVTCHIDPMLVGGGQERRFRPGTENTPMIVGLGAAAKLVQSNLSKYERHMVKMRNHLEQTLLRTFDFGIVFNCKNDFVPRLPNTCSVSFLGRGLKGHQILRECKGLEASTGAACHDGGKPSEVLINSGVSPSDAAHTIRLSVGRETSTQDIEFAVQQLGQAVFQLKKAA